MIISSRVCVRLCFCRVGYWLIPCPYLSLTLNGGGVSCEFVNGTFHKSPRVQTLCFQGQIVFHEKLIEWSVHHWANVSHYLHSEKNSIEVSLLMAFAGFGSSSTNCESFSAVTAMLFVNFTGRLFHSCQGYCPLEQTGAS